MAKAVRLDSIAIVTRGHRKGDCGAYTSDQALYFVQPRVETMLIIK